jgi:hypothetical protein
MGRFKVTEETKNIHCRVKIGNNKEADGDIVRQKGTKKFLVTDGTNIGACTMSDLSDGKLTNNTMTTSIIKDDKEIRLEYLSNKYVVDFDGNRYLLTVDYSPSVSNCEPAVIKTVEDAKKAVKKKEAKKPAIKKTAIKKTATKKKTVIKKTATKKSKPNIKEESDDSGFNINADKVQLSN